MLDMSFRVLASLIHVVLMLGLAPLLMGLIATLRARLLGRAGPAIWQPYRDIRKLLRKVTLIPDTATQFYKIWPFVSFVAMAAAAVIVPGFALNLLTARLSDFITLIFLFALSRSAMLLGGLETGFGFGALGAGRAALFNIFAEAALLMGVLVLASIAGNPTVDGIANFFNFGQTGYSLALGLAVPGILAVALSDTGRIPFDNPAGHRELGMVHRAMQLEYSGRYLALFQYTACVRLMTWFSLIAALFCPFGMAQAEDFLSWPLGLISWVLKLSILGLALALFELSAPRRGIFKLPEFLGAATMLGLLSAVFLFLAGCLGG